MRAITIYAVLAVAVAGCGAPASKESLPAPAPVAPTNVAPVAQTPEAALTPESIAQAAANDSEIICRNEKPLGTRIGKRVCKSRAQFKLEEEAAQQMMKNRDRKGGGGPDPVMGN